MTPNEQTLSDNMHKALGVQQAKHTPTPYHIEKFQNRYEIWRKDDGSTHSCVGSVATLVDAQFIIRACNCHDDLLAACKAAGIFLDNVLDCKDAFGVVSASPRWIKAREQVEAAIAKAEGNL